MSISILNELRGLPPVSPEPSTQAEVEVSLIIPARRASHSLESAVKKAHAFLSQRFGSSFEIVLVPNPRPGDHSDSSIAIAEKLSTQLDCVKSCPHSLPPGKGAAVRTGLIHSRGKWIFLTDSDLPYDLEFFDSAIRLLREGLDLVTGNRRLPSSTFQVPVGLLRLAYGRHRLGLWFNQLVRWFLPIHTTDTQAGIKAFSRRLALEFSKRQSCPGFLFDLEIFLTAHGQSYPCTEFPVTLHLNSEKSTVRILRECILVAFWLTRITWRTQMQVYGDHNGTHKRSENPKPGESARTSRILSRYKHASLSTRLFLNARWRLTPYQQMASHLPERGTILDLGCGHGLFSLAAALNSPTRTIVGIDHDAERVTLGSKAVSDLPNIHIRSGNLAGFPEQHSPYSGIAMIDVMHYFDPQTQEDLLKKAFSFLDPGGILLVREVDPEGGFSSRWNRLYEKLATAVGFTQAEKKGLHFRTKKGWQHLMEKAGFKVTAEPCTHFLFADILYICERPH